LCCGHLLLEDVPGLGKTTLAKVVSKSMALSLKRFQCTPDLLPADITGVSIFDQKDQAFRFMPGPIFSNILLTAVYRKFVSGCPRTLKTPAGGQSARLHRFDEGRPGLGDDRRQLFCNRPNDSKTGQTSSCPPGVAPRRQR
jgi:hypothetical protein